MGDVISAVPQEQSEPNGMRLETRSIDYIPLRERRGRAWHLGTIWFVGNAELVTVATGAIGIFLGLNFVWTCVALVIGTLIGAIFMAFHSAQGPKLGLSQMIQSRPQFGYYGSLFPIAAGLFIFIGFAVFGVLLGGQLLNSTLKIPTKPGYFIITALALLLTVLGYSLIHRFSRWATYLYLANFGLFTVVAATHIHLAPSQYTFSGTFQGGPFLIVVGIFVSYNLTWAPYVSDYSRYLPKDTPLRATFGWTYLGTSIGSIWPGIVGALIAAAYPKLSVIGTVRATGDQLFHGWGFWTLILVAPSLIFAITLGIYTAGLSTLAGIDVVHAIKTGFRPRVIAVTGMAVVTALLALLIPGKFLTNYNAFLLIVLYFIIPWTAINLVDFFFVRHGQYALKDLFNPRGIYGPWGWRGLVAYCIAFLAMIPFFSTTIFTGPAASALGGGDISPFVGAPIAAILYYVLCRNLNKKEEAALSARQLVEVEAEMGGPVGA